MNENWQPSWEYMAADSDECPDCWQPPEYCDCGYCNDCGHRHVYCCCWEVKKPQTPKAMTPDQVREDVRKILDD